MINSLSETVIYTFLSDDSEKRLEKKDVYDVRVIFLIGLSVDCCPDN